MTREGSHFTPLDQLLDGLPVTMHRVDGQVMLCTLVEDSRRVQPGCIFLARQGTTTDGRDWIPQAEKDGASLILSDQSGCDRATGPALSCDDPVRIGALLAERLHGSPSSTLKLVGITGTNGKTTTATILQHLLASDDAPCGLIGGIEVDDGCQRTTATLTTPQAADLSGTLGRMIGNGCRFAVMEVSSHALDLGRVSGLHFSAALFTNLSGDHLDHHGDMDSYAGAKRSLFTSLDNEAVAVINVDDPRGMEMSTAADCHVIECGPGAAAQAVCLHEDLNGSRVRFDGPWGSIESSLPLAGQHNIMNALQAVATAHHLGISIKRIARLLPSCPCPPGRLERIPGPGPAVFVDFAHTDDALASTLCSLRRLMAPDGALHVVFGCGGDRDRSKRPRMALVACNEADRVILTSDNPRREPPQAILDDIMAGVPAESRDAVTQCLDRGEAIRQAITTAAEPDVVLIAGKGHEQFQLVGDRCIPFRDDQVAAAALGHVSRADSTFLEMGEIAQWLDGTWLSPPSSTTESVTHVTIDSRQEHQEVAGGLFVAIRGQVHDGHDHVKDAAAAGASMLLVDREIEPAGVPTLQVEDTRAALGTLASRWRDRLQETNVVAITGSCGKTTTKELLRAILSTTFSVHASRRSFNNDIGLPLTILGARQSDDWLVLEVGTNAPGEIACLAGIARPDFAIVTMIGAGHLEGLDTLEGVAKEKYALLPFVSAGGVAWIHADGYPVPADIEADLRLFGDGEALSISSVQGGVDSTTCTLGDGATFTVGLPGRHNAENSLPVIALAREHGIPDEVIAAGLAAATPARGRGQRVVAGGITFVDESYNANPDSMRAAIEAFLDPSHEPGPKVLVLGDMLELGEHSPGCHAKLADLMSPEIDLVLLVGQEVSATARALASRGWPGDKIAREPDIDDAAIDRIAALLRSGDRVLLKGSRGIGLERIILRCRSTETEVVST